MLLSQILKHRERELVCDRLSGRIAEIVLGCFVLADVHERRADCDGIAGAASERAVDRV